MVVYGCLKISQTVMVVAKTAIRISFQRSITHFFRNSQASFMVVYGCFKIPQTVMGVAKIAIRTSFPRSIT